MKYVETLYLSQISNVPQSPDLFKEILDILLF